MTAATVSAGPLPSFNGRAVVLRGDSIDTDRITPGRFLKVITFAGIERGLFADEREALRDKGKTHPFDDPRHQGATILLVDKNFGCGSSREHAPQALRRWGITAVVGESFGEIFAANCLAIGMPCLRADGATMARLREAAGADDGNVFTIDIAARTIVVGESTFPVDLPDGARVQLLDGTWDAMAVLLAAGPEIERTTARLPYLRNWQ